MSGEVATTGNPVEQFQTRILDKLKADIGGLMPDEVLRGLMTRAVEEQFFKTRTVKDGYNTVEKPSWFVEEVGKHAKPIIEQITRDWLEVNKSKIAEGLEKFLEAQNLTLLTFAALRQATSQDLYEVATQIVTAMKRGY